MSGRAGYTLVVYVLDVSPSMGEMKADPAGTGGKRQRLDWAKELIARQCEPKSGRKTEAVGLVSFGGRTNNQANRSWLAEHPDDDDPPYAAVSSDVAIQTAKPKTLEVLMNLDVGEHQGNPLSGLMVALDMIEQHKHTKAWSLEIVLVTDGESEFSQEEFEDAMERLDTLGVRLSVVGIDFQDPTLPVEKEKSRNKRLAEKFWRAFVQNLTERIQQTSEYEKFLPKLSVLDPELVEARRPHPAVVNGTVSGIHLYIGSAGIDDEQAISIPIKYSKATMKARPPSLSKAWKAAVELQQPSGGLAAAQLRSQAESQSQAGTLGVHDAADVAAMISSDVKRHSTYVVKHTPGGDDPTSTQASGTQLSATQRSEPDPDILPMYGTTQTQATQATEAEGEEEFVPKEDLVKAWRFGSSWVPMEADTFEPLHTQKGVEVLGFVPQANIRKYMLIGEVRYVWPDISSPKAQIQFSSFVSALITTGMAALVRWVLKDDAEPHIGVCIPQQDFPGEDKKLDLMYWIKLPFADDDHKFWFPSLTKYKTATGKEITEHPFIPTKEQCDLMDALVEGMDLDNVKPPKAEDEDEEDEDEEDEDEEMETGATWFDPSLCVNPVIHRIKEAIFHASLTADLKNNPLPPPHPDIVKYFHTPDDIAQKVEKITEQLKEALDIKKIPPRQRKKYVREGLREDEGYLDIDELFGGSRAIEEPSATQGDVKNEPISPAKPKIEQHSQETKPKIEHASQEAATRPKPKPGRLVSNEQPLEDFNRLVQGEGDVFRKAIQDLGAVVKENVTNSFSHSAFPLALKCLQEMRSTALTYEEVETYNEVIDDLEKTVKAKGFKHPDFWDHFTKSGKSVARITPEEAAEALEEEEYD